MNGKSKYFILNLFTKASGLVLSFLWIIGILATINDIPMPKTMTLISYIGTLGVIICLSGTKIKPKK